MADRYDGMSNDQLTTEARRRGIRSTGSSEDGDGKPIDKANKSELQSALRDYDKAQLDAEGAGGEEGDEGTSKNADRSRQRPGAGDDPGTTTDPAVTNASLEGGQSLMGQARGDEPKS